MRAVGSSHRLSVRGRGRRGASEGQSQTWRRDDRIDRHRRRHRAVLRRPRARHPRYGQRLAAHDQGRVRRLQGQRRDRHRRDPGRARRDRVRFGARRGRSTSTCHRRSSTRRSRPSRSTRSRQATKWSDVDPSLPAADITGLWAAVGSGTRDALIEMVAAQGLRRHAACSRGSRTASRRARPRSAARCARDSAYIDQGEQDKLIVRKVAGNEHAVAIFGFSYVADIRRPGEAAQGRRDRADRAKRSPTALIRCRAAALHLRQEVAPRRRSRGSSPISTSGRAAGAKAGALSRIGLVPSHDDELAANAEDAHRR